MRYEETKTISTRETEQHHPVSARAKGVMLLLAIAATVYVIVGMRYASGHTMDLAGMSGPAYWAAYAAQVLGWPAMLIMH